jgi:hypothetical protein
METVAKAPRVVAVLPTTKVACAVGEKTETVAFR